MKNKSDKNDIKLSKYYVAYIDMLGTTDYINSEDSESYLNILHTLYQNAIFAIKNIFENVSNVEIKFKIFSDNIIIAIQKDKIEDNPYNFEKASLLINLISHIQVEAIQNSITMRGGIVIDDLYIDDTFVYGKALTNAYQIESSIAIYPRVVIESNCITEFLRANSNIRGINKDQANIYYLNPFENYFEIFFSFEEETIQKINQILIKKINEDFDNKAKQKNYWFINLFNDFCEKNNHSDYVINIDDYPYPTKVEKVIYTGMAKEFFNAK